MVEVCHISGWIPAGNPCFMSSPSFYAPVNTPPKKKKPEEVELLRF